MKIEYYIEVDDLVQFNRYHFNRNSLMKKIYFLIYSFGIASMFFTYLQASHLPWTTRAAGFLFYSAIYLSSCWFMKWFFFTVVSKKLYSEGRNRGTLGRHQLILEADKLIELTSVNETHHAWAGIERVEENERHVLIYINNSAAHVIPKRAFASREEERAFFETAVNYHGRSLGLPQYCGAPANTFPH